MHEYCARWHSTQNSYQLDWTIDLNIGQQEVGLSLHTSHFTTFGNFGHSHDSVMTVTTQS